ncbi:amphi-Trp domain-containing protein [Haloferacaceae archaeon DSL9]
MADKTSDERELSRSEIAAELRALADEFDREGEIRVRAGNKTIQLSPRESAKYRIDIRESSSLLRGSRESVAVEMSWKPK